MWLFIACPNINHSSMFNRNWVLSWFHRKYKNPFKGERTQAPLCALVFSIKSETWEPFIIRNSFFTYTWLLCQYLSASNLTFASINSHLSTYLFNTTKNVLPQHKVPGILLAARITGSWKCKGGFIQGQRGMHRAISRVSDMSALCWGWSKGSHTGLL